MLNDILAPLSQEDFFRDYWTRNFLHIPGQPGKFSHFYSWEFLNKALEEHRFDEKRLVLYRGGMKIEPDRYLNGRWVDSGKLVNELSHGATLIFNACEETCAPLRELCAHLERLFHHRVTINLYAGWRRDNGFNVHWDEQDNLILQVAGRKHWKVWNPTRLHPFKADVADTSTPPAQEPIWDGVLEPGDLFSIPRGWWHVAYPLNEPCLHLTVTSKNPTGIDLLHWMADRMKSSEAARMAVPVLAAPAEGARWLQQLQADMLAEWDETIIDRYIAEIDSKTISRPRISLPVEVKPLENGIQRATLLELAVSLPLQFSIQEEKALCYAGGMTLQMDAGVAEKLERFNDRRPHRLKDLSPSPDLRLKALVGVMVMKGILRRVADPRN